MIFCLCCSPWIRYVYLYSVDQQIDCICHVQFSNPEVKHVLQMNIYLVVGNLRRRNLFFSEWGILIRCSHLEYAKLYVWKYFYTHLPKAANYHIDSFLFAELPFCIFFTSRYRWTSWYRLRRKLQWINSTFCVNDSIANKELRWLFK